MTNINEHLRVQIALPSASDSARTTPAKVRITIGTRLRFQMLHCCGPCNLAVWFHVSRSYLLGCTGVLRLQAQ
jgi:D-serine deaminase-like pyridoxal phosphate-dependent protein